MSSCARRACAASASFQSRATASASVAASLIPPARACCEAQGAFLGGCASGLSCGGDAGACVADPLQHTCIKGRVLFQSTEPLSATWCGAQGVLVGVLAAVLAAVAVLVWLLQPPQHTYLVDWYSFRPPDRCAGSGPLSDAYVCAADGASSMCSRSASHVSMCLCYRKSFKAY